MTEVVAEPPTDDTARLSRATIGMTAGTLLSRVTGFGRIVALAYALGLGSRARLADTYNLANTTPNIVYDLLLLATFRKVNLDDRQAPGPSPP